MRVDIGEELRLGRCADKVRHLHRDDHGELDKPAKHTLAEPRCLVDELLDARLFDCVRVCLVGPHHLLDLCHTCALQVSHSEIQSELNNKCSEQTFALAWGGWQSIKFFPIKLASPFWNVCSMPPRDVSTTKCKKEEQRRKDHKHHGSACSWR